MSLRNRVAGVDFSGARNAGNNIWIATGAVTPDGIRIEAVRRAADLPNGGESFTPALEALVRQITILSDYIIGLDFPFSLPIELIEQRSWISFAEAFSRDFAEPDDFRSHCRSITGGKELKRRTDIESRVPWCAYNIRLYRQTWAGIRHVLAPLAQNGQARVIPMQTPKDGIALLAEICPASLLKREGLYKPYKGRGDELRAARAGILTSLTRRRAITPIRGKLRRTILDNPGGDALDSVLAAIGAGLVETAVPRNKFDRIESRVYF